MSYPYRCSKAGCRKRISLPKHIGEYTRIKLCPACHNDSLKYDAAKVEENKRLLCRCDGYHFPHRVGSGVWCIHSKKQPTDQDYIDRYGQGGIYA